LVIAADCNSIDTIDVLINVSREQRFSTFQLWESPLFGAVCNVHSHVVQSILSYVGRGFFPQEWLLDFVTRQFNAAFVQQEYENTLLLLLGHDPELELTEDVMIELFRNKFHDGRGLTKALLIAQRPIEITRRLVNSSFLNPYCGKEMMDGLLMTDQTTSITQDAFLDLLQSAEWPVTDKARMGLLKKRREYQQYRSILATAPPGSPFRRQIQLNDIATTAFGKLIESRQGIFDILINQAGRCVELTWEHLLLLEGIVRRVECVQCLFQPGLEISQTAIYMLLSSWEVELVAAMLRVRRIKVTKDIIRAVAWNKTHGEKIMQLLLEKELEDEI